MSTIKKELRAKFSTTRDAYMLNEFNKASCENTFLKSELYNFSNNLLIYYPIKSEPDTLLLIQKAVEDGKNVYLPKVTGDTMFFYKIKELKNFKIGAFNIPEPETENPYLFNDAVCVVPGLAFDKSGNRLGYGKGYYDRFLFDKNYIITVGFCPKCNFFQNLPTDENDISMKYIIADNEIFKI